MSSWTLPEIDSDLCNQCGRCIEYCPSRAVEMTQSGPVIVRPGDCTYCTECEAVCPQGAIRCGYEIVWGAADGIGTERQST